MSDFWRTWITVWCWTVCLFGIVLAGGGLEVTSGPIRFIFDLLDGSGNLNLDAYMRFSLAILGAVTLGWGLTLLATVKIAGQLAPPLSKSMWVWVTLSVVIWYLLDSALSIITGFGLNAVSNTILVATFLLPVVRSGVLADQ